MAEITKGTRVQDLVGQVLSDLGDANGIRTPPANVLSWFRLATVDLATHLCFVRTDVIEVVQGKAYYDLFSERAQLISVHFNHKPLEEKSELWLINFYGSDWLDSEGTPLYYNPRRNGLGLFPQPDASSTALTFTGSPAITEEQGEGIEGHQYCCADNAGTKVYFERGDGEVTNETTAENLLEVKYYYVPRALRDGSLVPTVFEEVLMGFARYRARARSKVQSIQAMAADDFQSWRNSRAMVLGNPEIGETLSAAPIKTNIYSEFG